MHCLVLHTLNIHSIVLLLPADDSITMELQEPVTTAAVQRDTHRALDDLNRDYRFYYLYNNNNIVNNINYYFPVF